MSDFLTKARSRLSPDQLKAPPTREELLTALGEIAEAHKVLRKRVEDLEAGGIKYCGIHQRAMEYRKGSVVTHGGSAWIAVAAVSAGQEPGKSDSWQLAVKAGRDAR